MQREQKTIYVKESNRTNDHCPYAWAWKESADLKIFGGARSISEIVERAKKMFPTCDIVLSLL